MRGIIAIVIASAIWGAAPPIFKYALSDIPPFTLGFIRFFVASLILLPFTYKKIPKIPPSAYKDIILGALWGISVNVSFFFLGLSHAPSINVHIFSSLGPIVLYILSLVILRERPHKGVMKGMIMSFAGALIIIFGPLIVNQFDGMSGYSMRSQIIGNLLYLLSMFGAVMMVIHVKKVIKKVDALTLTSVQFFIGSLPFFPLMIHELSIWSLDKLTVHSWVGIIYGIFFSSALAYVLHNYALTRMSAIQVGIFNYMMPVIAVVVAIPLLGEYPDAFFIIGAALVIIGVWISEHHPHYKKLRKKTNHSS